MKPIFHLAIAAILLAACGTVTPDPTPETPPLSNPWAPQPGDSALVRGLVYIDSTEMVGMMSYPVQFALTLTGNLPTPCHNLRMALSDPDPNNRIAVEVYSVVDPNMACVQALEPFEATVPLGGFPTGHYTVEINGEQVAEFDA